jgi:2-keto-4-pentenoate hydratase/2-oxohepta-3-ene-1,7-dioic acid hydratase in catechol pathway
MMPPTEPALFMKATSAITGPFDPPLVPRDHSNVDWEIELGVVIGKLARPISPKRDEVNAHDPYSPGFENPLTKAGLVK